MSKSVVQHTPEEIKERHEFKARKRKEQELWEEQLFEEQLDELCSTGLRNHNPE